MNLDCTRQKVQDIICDILCIDQIPVDAQQADVAEWDSIAYISIVDKLEAEFGITLTPDNIDKFDSVENIIQEISPLKTILDHIEKHCSDSHGAVICEIEDGQSVSYPEFYRRITCRAREFDGHQRKIIAAVLPNSICYLEYFFATLASNNIFCPIPYFVSRQELKKILSYLDAYAVLTDREDIDQSFTQDYNVKLVHDASLHGEPTPPRLDIDPAQAATLYYSSGTTDNPKGVLYSHHNMVSLIASIVRAFKFSRKDRVLTFLPFGHTASINYNLLPALMAGSSIYISKGFENLRGSFFKVLAEHKITYTQIVPTVLLMLNKIKADVTQLDLEAVRFIGCGSSTLPLVAQKEFMHLYGIKTPNLYGLSETGPSHFDDPTPADWEPGSLGVPLDVNECRIADDGEILLKGANVFMGYYKNDVLYDQVVQDGWFHTGDLGEQIGEKFYFVDRKKDLIIKGGINIVPMEIEEVLYKHANVYECVVVGRPNRLGLEEIVAVVVAKQCFDETQFKSELRDLCKEHLSTYKIPNVFYFARKLPKTHSNKLIRRKVRDTLRKSEIDSGVSLEF